MNAYVSWLVIDTDVDVRLEETIHLRKNDAGGPWIGTVTSDEFQTTVTVRDTLDPVRFTLTISLTQLGTPLAEAFWIHYQDLDEEEWDTGLLEAIPARGIREYRLRLLA